jgi:hypothetical protein
MASNSVAVSHGNHDTWGQAYATLNSAANYANADTIVGNFFLGLQGQAYYRFPNPGVPRGATINSADIDFVGNFTNNIDIDTQMRALAFNPQDALSRAAMGIIDGVDAWRPEAYVELRFDLKNDSPATIANNASAQLTTVDVRRDATVIEVGTVFTTGSSQDLGSIDIQMRRVGNPTGSSRVEIREVDSTVAAGNRGIPSSTVVETSSTVAHSSMGTTIGTETFNFASETLPAGTYHAVLRPDTFTLSATDHIEVSVSSVNFNPTNMSRYGTLTADAGFSIESYLGVACWPFMTIGSTLVGWDSDDTPSVDMTAGAGLTTPDIAAIIQEIVTTSWYQPSHPMGIRWDRSGGVNTNRRARTKDSGSGSDAPVLNVDWTPRRVWSFVS